MTKDYFKIAIRNLRVRPFRSWLTIFGIIIGIFLIVTLLSLGEGVKTAVLAQLRMLGGNLLIIYPGEETNPLAAFFGGLELTRDDVKIVERTEGIESVVPMTTKAIPMRYKGESKLVFLCGHPWEGTLKMLEEYSGWSLYKGRWPEDGKMELAVGYKIATDAFEHEMEIGDRVTIKGRRFEIVGIVNKLGEQIMDTMVNLDLDIFRDLTGERKAVQTIMAQVAPERDVDEMAQIVKERLQEKRKRKGGEEVEDIAVVTSGKIGGIVGNILGIIELAIVGIASIAIIVGGIGIMNTMYTSVRDRTKEIGIMKAIGARNSAILSIFLFEAGIIGIIGGILGTGLGLGLAKLAEFYAVQQGFIYLQASTAPSLIILGLVFAFLIGCISGFFPARRASKLKPVDALRYE